MFSFSDQYMAGQRLIIGFEGMALNNELKFLIKNLKIGGIILFAYNLNNPKQIKDLCFSAQEYAASCGIPPLFIAIDQEGGSVARLKKPFTIFPKGNPGIKSKKDAVHFAQITSNELKSVGINTNLAPVLDIAPKDIDSIMKKRVFGSDPNFVSEMGCTIIQEMQNNGIIAVAKHFPGIGRTVLDSHLELPSLDIEIDKLKQTDLIPFQKAIKSHVSGIMLSHILYSKIDPKWQASLSPIIAKKLLRDDMHFNGIVMTDDLDMNAISYDIAVSIKQILDAEIDIALICHKGPDIENAFEEILKNLKNNKMIKEKGEQSIKRIMDLKSHYLNMIL